MARNKAVFDADILINLVNTKSIDYILNQYEQVYISYYVLDSEIKAGTQERKKIDKLINRSLIKVLYVKDLTDIQRKFYYEAYNTLHDPQYIDEINEGERITASFASAHKIHYYMSDDNKAAPHIRALTKIEIINYCDLLYISYRIDIEGAQTLKDFYDSYLSLFDVDKIPRVVRNRNGTTRTFPEMMAKSYDKFDQNEKLSRYLNLMINSK